LQCSEGKITGTAYDQTSEKKSLWNINKETCRTKDLNQGIRQHLKAYIPH